jgi:hypothetical protein
MKVRYSREVYETMGGRDFGPRKIARPKKRRSPPPWMYDDAAVQRFLLRMFPLIVERDCVKELSEVDPRRRRIQHQINMAGRWALIIKKYFIGNSSTRDIEYDWRHDLFPQRCRCAERIVSHIRLASINGPDSPGLRQDGRSRTGRNKGRPRRDTTG